MQNDANSCKCKVPSGLVAMAVKYVARVLNGAGGGMAVKPVVFQFEYKVPLWMTRLPLRRQRPSLH